MKKILALFLSFCFLIAGLFFAYKILIIKHISKSEETIRIVLDEPYFSAVKKLVSKNSLEKIAEKNNSKITNKEWDYLNLEMPKILRPRTWVVDGRLKFSTITNDQDLGQIVLDFCQDVDIEKEILIIRTYLENPSTNILEYEKEIKITPLDKKIELFLSSKIKIAKTIPAFCADYMNKKVKLHNQKDIKQLEDNIINIISGESKYIKIK
jgi:hypothetical protein